MRVLLAFPPSPRNHQFTLPLNLMDYTRFLTEVQAYGIVFSWLAYFMNNNNQNAFKIHRWCSIWHNTLPFYIPLGVWCADISEALFSILLGIYPEVELLHFLRNPQTAFHSGRTILHFHQQCTRVQISHVLAHTCYFVFTVAIFMMVRSVMFKVLKNQKKWTQKPSSFLPFFLYFFPFSLPAQLLTSTTSVGQPCQPPNKGTTKHISISQANPAK